MCEYDINPDLLDVSQSILKDRGVPQGWVRGSLSQDLSCSEAAGHVPVGVVEDRSGEGFHVNSNETRCFCQLRKLECFKHALSESLFCVFVWCSGQRLLRCVLRAAACFALVARLALLERGIPCSSVVSRHLSLCCLLQAALVHCVPHLMRHSAFMAQGSRKHCSCHVITIHFITHGSGAGLVVLIRIA